jgi:PAS domain S-box-containing protein
MALPDALLRAVFDQAAVPIVLVDARGVLATWNPAFEALFRELFGAGPGRLPVSFFDFIAEREGARFDYYAAEVLLGGRATAAVESPVRAADGTLRYVRLALSRVEPPSRDAARPERYLLCAVEEVTDRILRERRLQAAKDEAEKATETKSQFLANMSHEIRTPIQTILGVVELLHETELDSEQADYVNQVRFSADVLLGLINDILDFSKIEAGRLELETTSFELRACVHGSVDLLAMEANRKGLEIIVDIDESLPALVRGDPGRLRQIIVNLLKNAVKFTAEGAVALTLGAVGSPAGARLRFEVVDTGPGMPESTRERLFTPFFQGDPAQARKAGGTGLGLAISRHLVELMGGAIGVRPGADRGSVFWFEIPLDAPEYSGPAQAGTASALPGRQGSGERLLVVDDYPLARSFAARTAASAGYRVSEAASGEEALAELRRAAARGEPFAACLIDQTMPVMDGWRLAGEINGDTSINGARLILMSPVATISADAKMKLLRWFNGYIAKPLKRGELLDALAHALSSSVDLESAELEGLAEPKPRERRFEGRVLLAEDHEVNRELFTLLLGKMGCEVVTAKDGVEAVEMGSSGRFDLVLMDIFMPRMSGYEAARALRDRGHAGPIVAVTASALKGERENCLEAGMNDILVKPFKKDDLAAILALYLPSSGAEAEGDRPERATASRREAQPAAQPSAQPMAQPAAQPMAQPLPKRELDVFDWAGVLDTFLGQAETVAGLLSRFIDKAGAQMGELAEALAAKDATRFREVSHSLKGASWNLSARRLGDAAHAGETAGREGDMDAAARALDAMRVAYSEFAEAAGPHSYPRPAAPV